MTRAERSAKNKADHAARIAKEQADKADPTVALTSEPILPPTTIPSPPLATPVQSEAPPPAQPDTEASPPPSDSQRAHVQDAPTHARTPAREGTVLDDTEYAGLVDHDVPPETAATARHLGKPLAWTMANSAQVQALRFAGQDDEEIALFLGCSIEELYRVHRDDLADAHAKMGGKLAINAVARALQPGADFKTVRFFSEKRLRGFGRQDQGFMAVRPNGSGALPQGVTSRNAMGQSPEALGIRDRKAAPAPNENGRVAVSMVLGVAERPLAFNKSETDPGREKTDEEIAADVAARAREGDA